MYGIEAGRLLGTERKRSWVAPRSLLVYAAREWCGIKANGWRNTSFAKHR